MLANAVYQAMAMAVAVAVAMAMALTDRVRGQARSYSGFGSSPNSAFGTTSLAGLLANAVGQKRRCQAIQRLRQQAGSYGRSPV
ncbi:hypothetical protein IFT62_23970 [Pseudomonas lutea]|uniref:Uncharacterized protein n=1 Tax=Pseudomonas lutea TaxID=243924 RepID=A0ABR9AEW1_9PSED|nr:hypothetical protein [Pseudomonas lutea]MBD8124266.1 hypothetical protein [Pseudomonas lutea]